jgi:hypothetical protein
MLTNIDYSCLIIALLFTAEKQKVVWRWLLGGKALQKNLNSLVKKEWSQENNPTHKVLNNGLFILFLTDAKIRAFLIYLRLQHLIM